MNSEEFVDLTKMAIRVLLISMVLSSILAFFYVSYDVTAGAIDSMDTAARSASMDRLYELQDQTNTALADNTDSFPLVSNVTNALSEFNENSFLFILVGNGSTTNCYTFNGISMGEIHFTNAPPGLQVKNSNLPNTEACKELLRYSDKRCQCYIIEAKYGGQQLNGIQIQIM